MQDPELVVAEWGLQSRWIEVFRNAGRTADQDATTETFRATRSRDGSEFINEELILAALLADGVTEIDEEAIEAFRIAFSGDFNRLEDGMEAADDVLRSTWQHVDRDAVRRIMETSAQRGGRISAGLTNVLSELRNSDEVFDGMMRSSKYYTNNYFSRIVMPSLRTAVDNIVTGNQLVSGQAWQVTRELLDARLQSVPYWQLVSNQSASRAYHYGAVKAGQSAGYRGYQIVTVGDERRSDICTELDGKTFWLADAARHVERVANATEEEIAEVAPWATLSDVQGQTSASLRDMGHLMPPFHARCRSTISLLRS